MKLEDFIFVNAGGHIDVYLKKDEKDDNFIDCLCFALKEKYYFCGWDKQSCKMAGKINKQLYKIFKNKNQYKNVKKGNNKNKNLDY